MSTTQRYGVPWRGPRATLRHPVYVRPVGSNAALERFLAQDISLGGMFVWSGRQFPDGAVLSIDLEAHGLPTPFAEGEVLWGRPELEVDSLGRWNPPGFAVRFFPLSERAQLLLERLVLGAREAADASAAAP